MEGLEFLLEMGRQLEEDRLQPGGMRARSFYAAMLLRIRDRGGRVAALRANAVQRAFERRQGRGNIVLKARQMGLTTWIAGQYFLRTMTRPGSLTVQVAHTREAAEGIFGIVQRMWENLPAELREGALKRSRANAGQMVFGAIDSEFRVVSAGDENAGRGLTIQNLHCSEVSRWPGDAAATLTGLRAAMTPGGHVCLESTANGAYGCFYEEWERSRETGLRRHFFPWWMERESVGQAVMDWTEDETRLAEEEGLTAEQIGFRRGLEKSYRGLRAQEFAEDAVSCFKATGDCCFEVEGRLSNGWRRCRRRWRRGGAERCWCGCRRLRARSIWLPSIPQAGVSMGTTGRYR